MLNCLGEAKYAILMKVSSDAHNYLEDFVPLCLCI